MLKEYGTPLGWVLAWGGVVAYKLWLDDELVLHAGTVHALPEIAAAAALAWLFVRFLKKSRRVIAD